MKCTLITLQKHQFYPCRHKNNREKFPKSVFSFRCACVFLIFFQHFFDDNQSALIQINTTWKYGFTQREIILRQPIKIRSSTIEIISQTDVYAFAPYARQITAGSLVYFGSCLCFSSCSCGFMIWQAQKQLTPKWYINNNQHLNDWLESFINFSFVSNAASICFIAFIYFLVYISIFFSFTHNKTSLRLSKKPYIIIIAVRVIWTIFTFKSSISMLVIQIDSEREKLSFLFFYRNFFLTNNLKFLIRTNSALLSGLSVIKMSHYHWIYISFSFEIFHSISECVCTHFSALSWFITNYPLH